MTIKEFYQTNYSTDELGEKLYSSTTFEGLTRVIFTTGNVYGYIGVADSLVRERLFEELSNRLNCSYTELCQQWLSM